MRIEGTEDLSFHICHFSFVIEKKERQSTHRIRVIRGSLLCYVRKTIHELHELHETHETQNYSHSIVLGGFELMS